MTLQAAFESCSRHSQIPQRAEHRRVIREQLGTCFACGVSFALHFDGRNNFLPCGDPRVQAARVQQALHAVLSPAQRTPHAGQPAAPRGTQAAHQAREFDGGVGRRHHATEGIRLSRGASRVESGEGKRKAARR